VGNWLQLQLCSFGGNVWNFVVKKPFTILNAYMYALFSYSLALFLLYGGHCFSVLLPSKVMHDFHACYAPTHDDVSL